MPSETPSLGHHVGERIRVLRRARHLSADALALRLDWPKDTLINYEYGRRALTLDRLQQIATALDLSPLALLVADERLATLIEQLARDETLMDHVFFFLNSLAAEIDADSATHLDQVS